MSGERDSNQRPTTWKANALSAELLPQTYENDELTKFIVYIAYASIFLYVFVDSDSWDEKPSFVASQ